MRRRTDPVSRKSVLFVSHDAVRGGATLMLLEFLRWLRANTDLPFHVLLYRCGEMEQEFRKIAPVFYLDPERSRRAALRVSLRRLTTGKKTLLSMSDAASRIRSIANVGLIYSNTASNGAVVNALLPLRCPVLTHVHELEFAIRTFVGSDFEDVKKHTDHFVAVSEATRRNLITRHGVAPDKVERTRGFSSALCAQNDVAVLKRRLLAEIGASADARIVGGCGAITLHKGADLFVQLALAVRARSPAFPVHFVWIGSDPETRRIYTLRHDVEQTDLADCVHYIGAKANVLDYIAAFDVYALVSREESLSLVMLEAAASAVPTVCFDGHGSREFVEQDAGAVVPYLDVQAMAERVLELLEADGLRRQYGERAREKARERHDISVVAPQLLGTIERLLSDTTPR
jgi:glycosyltransferase involved in cell wall biosynthesis